MAMSSRQWLRALLVVVVALLLWPAGSVPSSADDGVPPGYPPFPDPAEFPGPGWSTTGVWSPIYVAGVGQVQRQRQGVRMAPLVLGIQVALNTGAFEDPSMDCDGENDPNVISCFWQVASATVVSPPGAESDYGLSEEFTVRSVAFGSIPVEVTARVAQIRDQQNRPIPIRFPLRSRQVWSGPTGAFGDAWVYPEEHDARVFLEITRLRVDGVPITLDGRCRTASPAVLHVEREGLWQSDWPAFPPSPFNPDYRVDWNKWAIENTHFVGPDGGGAVEGTLSIGRFGPCRTTAGEDLAPLLTASMSGDDNPVRLHMSMTSCSELQLRNDDGRPTIVAPGGDAAAWRDTPCYTPPEPGLP